MSDAVITVSERNGGSYFTVEKVSDSIEFKVCATQQTTSDSKLWYKYSTTGTLQIFKLDKDSYAKLGMVKLGRWPAFDNITKLSFFVKNNDTLSFSSSSDKLNVQLLVDVCAKGQQDSKHQQKIIFGPPGTGKSHSVDAIAKKDLRVCEDNRVVTVFHPEYTYGDFIAKLMPLTNAAGGVEYKVVAGHFIKALAKALNNKQANVLLQIDEINRGNCAAIFGDIFQLLDRNNSGESSYEIDLSELAKLALKQEGYELQANEKVRIPANLSIIATMNTSDESVYFMDSAFKRRWQFQYISADTYQFNDKNEPVTKPENVTKKEVTNQADACVKYQADNKTCEITWDCLRRSINLLLIDNARTIRGIEDKQIGLWFVKAEHKEDKWEIADEDIQYKLMHYLWDNVFARDKKPLRDLLDKDETELATFGQFVKRKDKFVDQVSKYKDKLSKQTVTDDCVCPTEELTTEPAQEH